MTLPAADDIKSTIAAPCLVRPDRAGRALFISDFGRRPGVPPGAAQRLQSAGYVLTPLHGGMALIDWPEEGYLNWYRAQPRPAQPHGYGRAAALCRVLLMHPAPFENQDAAVLVQALRLSRLGDEAGLCGLLEGAAAAALRERRAVPCHGVHALLLLNRKPCSPNDDERMVPC